MTPFGTYTCINQDFRLIEEVAEEVWIVDEGEVIMWNGDVREYKMMLKKKVTDARIEAESKK